MVEFSTTRVNHNMGRFSNDITSFSQEEGESLYEAWERFKELLRKCPHHGLADWLQISSFYNGLTPDTRASIDATSGGSFTNKRPTEALELIESLATNSFNYSSNRRKAKKGGLYKVDSITSLVAQVESLSHELSQLKAESSKKSEKATNFCELCGEMHQTWDCPKNVFGPKISGQLCP